MSRPAAFALATSFVLIALPRVTAADDIAVETLLTGLKNPCGVAIRPGESPDRYEIFIADSGAGRIIRISTDAPKSPVDVVTGFALTELGDAGLPVGPLGLLFLDRKRLVVGVSRQEGASVQVFELNDESAPLTADASTQQITLKTDREKSDHVYAIIRTKANETVRDALVVTCFNNDQTGDVRTIFLRADMLTELALLTGSEVDAKGTSPAAIAIGDSGYVVVGWVGSLELPRDSLIAFYHPSSGAQLMELSTELHDILALAYSPRTGNLYTADAAWMDAKSGGVFRIDAAKEPGASDCNAVKIAAALRPSAMAFGPDGALYVTAFGELEDRNSPGMLLKITGDL